ncbi:MAG TPA: hypothetical protein VIR98_02465 [Candidatus Paceibacterota bacterium]|jgi:Indole-3-glycerol phosphate synthase
MKRFQIIAEVKTQSPFGFCSDKSWDELFTVANEIGDIVSIHTDPRWGGSFDLVRKAKSLTTKPILAKGIHVTDDDVRQTIEAGADYVLVVGRIPAAHADKCLVEPLTLAGLATFPGWLCQASSIRMVADVKVGADAVLVGQNLEEFARSYISSI